MRAFLLNAPVHGAIPHELRGSVWLLLMGIRAEDLLAEDANSFARAAREAVSDDNSKEQIEKDVNRTRPGLARFKQPAVRGALLRLLSLFCARRKVAYVQGFNELLAPFVLLADTGSNPRIVYALFSEFISRFAPWMLETSETRVFDVLKRAFKYFGRLLLYHDPELFWLLERLMMTPDLYATSWFVTLFARNFTIEAVLALWDLLLLEDNPLGTSFFGIALLRSKREELLCTDESCIPETLMMLTANSPSEVRRLWKIGSEMRALHTPLSFQRLMTDRLINQSGKPTQNALSAARAMQASVCLQTTPDDLVAGEAHFFAWDCRTELEYSAGHLAQAAHLPLDALRAANGRISHETSISARRELQHAVDLCEPLMNSSHICLVGSGFREEDNTDINVLALYLTELGIPYVSTLRDGFRGALAAAMSDNSQSSIELVDFDPQRHSEARRARVAMRMKREDEMRGAAAISNAAPVKQPGSGSEVASVAATPTAGTNVDGSPGTNGGNVIDDAAPPASSAAKGLSSFLEKTDSEVSRVLNRAFNGIGLNYAVSALSPGSGTEVAAKTGSGEAVDRSPSAGVQSPFSPDFTVSPANGLDSLGSPSPHKSESGAFAVPGGCGEEVTSLRGSLSSLGAVVKSGAGQGPGSDLERGAICEDGDTRQRNSNIMCADMRRQPIVSSSVTMNPRPGIQADPASVPPESPRRHKQSTSKSGGGFFGVQKSPWGRDAKPNWLGDENLSLPLSTMPRGFTVNVMDDRVMEGLRLFPCRARSDRSVGLRGSRAGEFKRRYVGVCPNYFLLFSPHSNRSHLLEVKLIRYLQDIARITFKRSRPELVTFEILTSEEEDSQNEYVVCIMPDGLKECVDLIKEYLTDSKDDEDVEDGEENGSDVLRPTDSSAKGSERSSTDIKGTLLSETEQLALTLDSSRQSRPAPVQQDAAQEEVKVSHDSELMASATLNSTSMDEFGTFQAAPVLGAAEETGERFRADHEESAMSAMTGIFVSEEAPSGQWESEAS